MAVSWFNAGIVFLLAHFPHLLYRTEKCIIYVIFVTFIAFVLDGCVYFPVDVVPWGMLYILMKLKRGYIADI
jgi:hypothetical protein